MCLSVRDAPHSKESMLSQPPLDIEWLKRCSAYPMQGPAQTGANKSA